ncbi:hypothetical protein LTR67_011328 [Exophiala xenobiotica]
MGDATPRPAIPKECLAGVVVNEGPDFHVEVRTIPVPEPGPDEVLVKLNCTGLCMSDIHCMLNDWNVPKMSHFGTKCAGHEGAGVIVKVGERTKLLKVGQRVGHKPILDVCHMCESCKSGRETYCSQAVLTGLAADGSYKQYVTSPERYTTVIPDGVSDYVAGPIMCSASTIYTSIKESNIRPGQWACFPGGGGGVGIQGVQLAKAMGLRSVVVDTGADRAALAREHGAEHFVDFLKTPDACAEVVRVTGGGAHAVFVTAIQAYPIGLGYLGERTGAKLMCIGLPPHGKYHIDVDPGQLISFNQQVIGTLVSNLRDIDETLDFARRGEKRSRSLSSTFSDIWTGLLTFEPTVVGLSKFNESVQKLKNGKVAGRIVVDFNLP